MQARSNVGSALAGLEAQLIRLSEALTRKQIDKKLAAPIAKLQKELARLFKLQGDHIVAALAPTLRAYFSEAGASLTEAGLDSDFDSVFDKAALSTSADMLDALDTAVRAVLITGGNDIIKTLGGGIAFNIDNKRAKQYIANYGGDLITAIDDTTRDDIKRLLRAGVANGTSYSEIAREIKARYVQMAVGKPQEHIRSRAELIAVTELGNAYQAGNLAAVETIADKGFALQKRWLTVGDDKVSEGCKKNADQDWIPLDTEFASGDARPLRFPGCRCVAQYRRIKG